MERCSQFVLPCCEFTLSATTPIPIVNDWMQRPHEECACTNVKWKQAALFYTIVNIYLNCWHQFTLHPNQISTVDTSAMREQKTDILSDILYQLLQLIHMSKLVFMVIVHCMINGISLGLHMMICDTCCVYTMIIVYFVCYLCCNIIQTQEAV